MSPNFVFFWIKVITLIRIRTINTIKINLILIDFARMRTVFVRPTRAKMNGNTASPVYRFIFNLYPPEHPVVISNQIKRGMLGNRI